MLYINFQLERFELYMIAMPKNSNKFCPRVWVWRGLYLQRYLQWGELKLKVAFQLGSMGVNNLPIEGRLVSQNLFVAWEGEMVDDWLKKIAKSKIGVPSWWRRDRREISTVQG